jgi:hypothetical protein
MMFRETGDTIIAIPQPSHAWLSGQAIRVWGNEEFGCVSPFEDVCLGAEQHDIGWLSWERSPTLNLQTGRPHAFRELDVAQHTDLWRQGNAMALVLGRYPALLVSLHGAYLYRNFDLSAADAAASAVVTRFLQDQAELQQRLCASLAGDRGYAQHVSPETLQRNRLLVSAADRLSIAVCTALHDAAVRSETEQEGWIRAVPTARGTADLRIIALDAALTRFAVQPWPFSAMSVAFACEGFELPPTGFTDTDQMRTALRDARRVRVMAELVPDERQLPVS